MEDLVKAFMADVLVQAVFGLVVIIVLGVSAMLGALIFGRGYKKRIAALETRASMSAITQTFTFRGDVNINRQLRDAIEAKTVDGLKETISCLPQYPLGNGHTYANLPDGTKIVTMADGEIRLAIPVHVEPGIASAPEPTADMSVTVVSLPKP